MSDLRRKVDSRIDDLEEMMNQNLHLTNSSIVEEQIASISKFWSILEDEDRDYIQGVQWALEEKVKWKDD